MMTRVMISLMISLMNRMTKMMMDVEVCEKRINEYKKTANNSGKNRRILHIPLICTLSMILLFTSFMPALAQPSPLYVYGYVFYANGTACEDPVVKITNVNTGAEWAAKTSQNMFGCIITNGTDVNTSETLQISAQKGVQSGVVRHTVDEEDIGNGVLFMNITLSTPPSTPFVVYGAVFYENGEPCENLTSVVVTNKNTGNSWNAEIHDGFNQYMLVISSENVSDGDVLEINATSDSVYNSTTRVVSSEDIYNGGIFDVNVTLPMMNMPPSVDCVIIAPDDDVIEEGVQIDPQPGGNKTVTISAVVRDMNGYADISSVVATINGPSDVADSPVTLNFVSNIDENTAIFNGSFNMSFYYLNGTYVVTVNATDSSGATGTNTSSFEYRTTIALRIDADIINFGNVNPGENSSVTGDEDFTTPDKPTIQNIGNTVINVQISGTDLVSASNDRIDKCNMSARVDACSFNDLCDVRTFDVQMPIGEAVYENVDFVLSVPHGTPSGNYTGSVTVTAVEV